MIISKRKIKILALLIVVVYIFTYCLPTRDLLVCKKLSDYDKAYSSLFSYSGTECKPIECATNLGKADKTFKELSDKLLQADNSEDLKNVVSEFRTQITELKNNSDNEFSDIKSDIDSSPDEIKSRYNDYKQKFYSQLNELESCVNKLDISDTYTTADNSETIKSIVSLVNDEQGDSLLASEPNNIVSNDYESEQFSAQKYNYSVDNNSYAPNDSDLAVTNDTVISDEIKKVADEYDNALGIYEYVKNNINYEAYYGSRKGATGAFDQKSGNDYDQTNLLISMLRYKGIPAHYVRGNVTFDIDKAMKLTGTQTPDSAVKTLAALGVPTTALYANGNIAGVKVERVWAEAYVPYENYRGAGKSTGKSIWVPLDAAFKDINLLKALMLQKLLE